MVGVSPSRFAKPGFDAAMAPRKRHPGMLFNTTSPLRGVSISTPNEATLVFSSAVGMSVCPSF
jgi:hypothetical protein